MSSNALNMNWIQWEQSIRDRFLLYGLCLLSNQIPNSAVAHLGNWFFEEIQIPQTGIFESLSLWEHALRICRDVDSNCFGNKVFDRLHKGTPYFWMGLASYQIGDFDKATFYMDVALSEDIRNGQGRWLQTPAAQFMFLNSGQFAQTFLAQGYQVIDQIRSIN